MAVPRNRHSTSRRNTKRSHHAKVAVNLVECKNCSKPQLSHRACMSCGHYNSRSLIAKDEA